MTQPQWKLGIHIAGAAVSPQNKQRLPEDSFCRELCLLGHEYGFHVFVFSPLHYDSDTGVLQGYQLHGDQWNFGPCPLPDIVYDRCYYQSRTERMRDKTAMQAMMLRHPWVRLGSQIPGKLEVYRLLLGEPRLAELLPRTVSYRSSSQLLRWLEREPDGIILKPDAGMQGRGILRIWQGPGGLQIQGRNAANRPYAYSFGQKKQPLSSFSRLIAGRSYLLQPYLRLTDDQQRPFDIRVLIQKNGAGRWSVTGTAIRIGEPHVLTANLHGGGRAAPAEPFLQALLGAEATSGIMEKLHQASCSAARRLEQHCGRLLELGLDFGLEESGRLWLLEANSKPGRSLFTLLGESAIARLSHVRPLQYARLLCNRSALYMPQVEAN
ncbi:YheC/YheD family protein [Paenibacillus sp. GCM10012307]|uniref:YheC/YheD family protein n=1 Tax=Paenibacillus roseus TaxID=2798579 RepID=A0A934IZF9_9BACL|nr:YheC/YheD family protein [Paenibacillus roseus]MBJ6362056.1 YheC/YheD family protein [Paenibacillus roseus]